MKTFKTLIITGIIFSLFACTPSETQNKNTKDSVVSADSLGLGIELNAGEKWKVNEQMMPFIKSSEQLLIDFKNDDGDYKTLATKLNDNNDQLIASCTMKGDSHDALHLWLHPHLELVGELENAPTSEDAVKVVKKLNQSFKAFGTYFQ